MTVIKNLRFLSPHYVPDDLPAREQLVKDISEGLSIGRYRVLLAGITGTGKTVSVTKALKQLGNGYLQVYLNCSECTSYSAMAEKIIETLTGKPYFCHGKTRSELAEQLKKRLEAKRVKRIAFIFDEVDKILSKKENHQEIFFPLLNYGDASFILISNDTNVLSKFDPRIYSRLGIDVKNIESYNLSEIYQILSQRAELGLIENSYSIEILAEIAKHSAGIGDIRFALKSLEQSAIITDKLGRNAIDAEIVSLVIKEVEKLEFEAIFNALPPQLRIVLGSIAIDARERGGFAITYPNSYNKYIGFCKEKRLIPVGDRRFRDFLTQLQMMDLIILQNKTNHKQGGRVRIAIPNFDYVKFVEARTRPREDFDDLGGMNGNGALG